MFIKLPPEFNLLLLVGFKGSDSERDQQQQIHADLVLGGSSSIREHWRRFGSVAVLLVLLHRGRGVVVKSLSHELQRQAVLVAAGLFDLGPLVLEPDLNLGLVQVQFLSQSLSPLLRYVPVRLELAFQSLQLLGRERGPRPLVLLAALLLLQFACPRAWRGDNKGNRTFIYVF